MVVTAIFEIDENNMNFDGVTNQQTLFEKTIEQYNNATPALKSLTIITPVFDPIVYSGWE